MYLMIPLQYVEHTVHHLLDEVDAHDLGTREERLHTLLLDVLLEMRGVMTVRAEGDDADAQLQNALDARSTRRRPSTLIA